MKKLDLKKIVSKAVNDAIEEVASDVTFEIEGAYENAIDKFYNDYKPRFYRRTYSTYLASDHYNDLSRVGRKGGNYVAGIVVSDFNIGQPYHQSAQFVFPRTFEVGIHGMTPEEAAGKGLSFAVHPYRSPKDLMDASFEKIKNSLDGRFDKAITKQLNKMLK